MTGVNTNGSESMADQTTPSSDSNNESALNNSTAMNNSTAIESADATIPASVAVASSVNTDAGINNASNTTTSNNPKGGGKGLGIVAILLALLALGGSAFNLYTAHFAGQAGENRLLTGVNSIGGDVKVLAERMNQLQRTQQQFEQSAVSKEQLQTRLLENSSQTDLALRDIKQSQSNLQSSIEKLTANNERGADKLALDEVSQLLKLANNSAVFSNDSVSAINAMKLADSQLQQLADPRYAVVRRAINQEINELEAVDLVDVTSLTAKLNALAKRIPSLPLENEPPVTGTEIIVAPEQAEETTVKSELHKLWVMVVNTVKIQRIDQPPKPLLQPGQRYFLDQNIQLKLSTAELAVMQSKPSVYQRNLDEALRWLLDYYDPRDDDVKKVVADLRQLKSMELVVELPSVAGSYDALQRIKGGN